MITSDDVRILSDVGFIAWSRGLDAEAASIFDAVRILRPKSEAGYIGAAVVELRRGAHENAVKILKSLPPSHTARAFLGLAYLNLGEREEGVSMLQDVIEKGAETPAGKLAASLLKGLSAPVTT